MPRTSWRRLDAGKALERIVTALAATPAGTGSRVSIPAVFTEADTAAIRLLPPWVVRAALFKSRGTWWLYCEPRAGARAGTGQFVLNVPPGRYMIDLLDTRAPAWYSRESAAAPPIVAGLPGTGAPVLARIRRVASSASRPPE